MMNRGIKILTALIVLLILTMVWGCKTQKAQATSNEQLKFKIGESGAFTFDTGILKGEIRNEGKSNGLIPVTYIPEDRNISAGEGFYNHYRVFTKGIRYGYGARRWPSTAKLLDDGNVEVNWPVTEDRPFELVALYKWVSPNTLDVITAVNAKEHLEDFEVFLASYYEKSFIDSRVWGIDPRGGDEVGFVSADEELGTWLAFPRDDESEKIISDGRWQLGKSPLEWSMMPDYDKPIAIRRDPNSGTTVISLTKERDCFGIFTPYGTEKHYSNYLSLFGYDIDKGTSAKATSRIVVLSNPSDGKIMAIADDFFNN